ncbi:UdgX family uracil-DNA binding protein [Benzoatithermus flavus]|uniref:Type-4 uracil-DNA glycosylase n=1 Tax=Benzoatithermus flavus TaxID=3108223 RepID=A0ABU8XRH0_9PROT
MADTALADLREQALHCQNCPLFADATQTVFGEGPAPSELMFVGEAPGDQEDRQGRPFVGPAGQLFDRALEEVGIDRRRIYLTNAVKHFKFILRGRRRIHQKPDRSEIEACKFWLFSEIELVQPRLIVAMGATAAQALMGRVATIGRERGRFQHYPPDRHLFVTVHPSFLLRVPDERAKALEYARFVQELRMIAEGPPVPVEKPEVARPVAALPEGAPAREAERKPRRGGRKASGGEGQFSLF